MTFDRLNEIRGIAALHPGRQSTALILELCDAMEETNRLYALAIDSAFSGGQRLKAGYAMAQLKQLVYREPAVFAKE